MIASVVIFAIGATAGGLIGLAVTCAAMDSRHKDDASRVAYLRGYCEQLSDDYHREELARDELARRCQQLYGMLGTDRCERCDEYCPREGEDQAMCVIADRLHDCGVEVYRPAETGLGFVSQCKEEDK